MTAQGQSRPESSEKRSPGRMYEYWAGGERHDEDDRRIGDHLRTVHPEVEQVVQAHGAFVRRAFAFFREQGIDQFILIGSGIPMIIDAQLVTRAGEGADHVLFVDIDSAEVPLGQAHLEEYHNATVIHAGLRELGQFLDNAEVRQVFDLARPLAVMFSAMLPFLTDDDEACAVVRAVRDALPSGSYIGLTHMTDENLPREVLAEFEAIYAASFHPLRVRGRAQVERFFEGLDLVPPGVVALPLWRPGSDDILLDRPELSLGLVGVGYKP